MFLRVFGVNLDIFFNSLFFNWPLYEKPATVMNPLEKVSFDSLNHVINFFLPFCDNKCLFFCCNHLNRTMIHLLWQLFSIFLRINVSHTEFCSVSLRSAICFRERRYTLRFLHGAYSFLEIKIKEFLSTFLKKLRTLYECARKKYRLHLLTW